MTPPTGGASILPHAEPALEVIGDFEVRGQAGRGRDGRGLSRAAAFARPAGRAEDPARRARGRCGVRQPLPARGARRRQSQPRESRARLFLGRGGWLPLHRHGADRGRDPRRRAQARRALPAPEALRIIRRCRPRAGMRLAARAAHPSRHQARATSSSPPRRGESSATSAWPRRWRRHHRPDPDRHGHGHAALHQPRAGARRQGHRFPGRHLLARLHALPDAHRAHALRAAATR